MIIPWQQIPPETLSALLEEFVTRDGTDYGVEEISTDQKVEQVLGQLNRQEVFIIFDEASESCNILSKEDAKQLGF